MPELSENRKYWICRKYRKIGNIGTAGIIGNIIGITGISRILDNGQSDSSYKGLFKVLINLDNRFWGNFLPYSIDKHGHCLLILIVGRSPGESEQLL